MTASRTSLCCLSLLATLFAATAAHALAQHVGREEEITDLRLGQRMLVDGQFFNS